MSQNSIERPMQLVQPALETEDEMKELRIADRTRAAKRRALESTIQSEVV